MPTNPEKIEKKTLVFLVLALTAFTGLLLFFFLSDNQWTTGRIGFISVFVVFTILIVLTLINQERFWWAPRLLAFMMLLAVIGSVLFILLNDIKLELKESLALSIAGLVLGLPSAFYVLWGNSGGKMFSQEYELLTKTEKRTFVLHQIIKLVAFVAVIILGAWFAYEVI